MSQAKKSNRRNYSQIDKEVFDLILKTKKHYIEDLEDAIDLTRDKAIKSISRLEKKGKLKCQKVMHLGRWTTEVVLIDDYGLNRNKSKNSKQQWDTLGNLPCFTCPNISKCSDGIGSSGDDEANPNYCKYITEWIYNMMNDKPFDKIFQPDFEEIRKKKRRRRKPEDE